MLVSMLTTFLARWKLYAIVAVLIAAVIGYAWWEGGSAERVKRRTAEGVITQQKEAAKQTAEAVDEAAKTNARIDTAGKGIDAHIDRLKQELRNHDSYYRDPAREARAVQSRPAVAQRELPGVHAEPAPPRLVTQDGPRDDYRLSIGTVRLLNCAAVPDRAANCAAERSDEESRAPSPVTRLDELEWILEVIRQYHRLAIRHKELVDYVQGLVDDQRERLKK